MHPKLILESCAPGTSCFLPFIFRLPFSINLWSGIPSKLVKKHPSKNTYDTPVFVLFETSLEAHLNMSLKQLSNNIKNTTVF